MPEKENIAGTRPPIVAVVGHIDHGKSTLLDYIRHSNIVEGEAGGITQHLSAYEALHRPLQGEARKITFLDTPGHEAFRAMRSRGLNAADVAILVVSAEEGVKPQTIEAVKLIEEAKIPFIVALTKIDKPGANIERAKMSLLEHQVFLEGLGGVVPSVAVSGKTGEGIPELLELILLAAELEGLSADPDAPGEGVVIEAHVDPRRGSTATLIVHDGSVRSGEFVVAGAALAPVRIMENFLGKPVKEALPGSPVRIVGFSSLPQVGERWRVVKTKKEAEEIVRSSILLATALRAARPQSPVAPRDAAPPESEEENKKIILPVVIKTDVAGTGDAVMHELDKLPRDDKMEVRVVTLGVGPVTEGDIKLAGGGKMPGIVVGFNVKVEKEARDAAERLGVEVQVFDVIYKLAEWFAAEVERRRPRGRQESVTASAKILKVFSMQKQNKVLGGKVEEGALKDGGEVKILRRDAEIGRGKIISLQSGKSPVKKVEEGGEFGAMVRTGAAIAAGDRLEAFEIVYK